MDTSEIAEEVSQISTDPKKLVQKENCIGYEKADGFYPMT